MHAARSEPAALRHFSFVLFAVIIAAFAVRNLPWHLDDYDQAKQAFVSFEMVEKGQWWFQHTPSGRIATKPPLAGWISATLYYLMGKNGWEFAWRLPSFASALILLGLLARVGRELGGARGALLAACAFGFNLVAPRLATLVRTDLLLTLLIFLAGWLVFEKILRAEPWTTRDRLWLSLAVLGSMLVKGPILYAFILPGLATYALCMWRRGAPNHAWSGWWPWLTPLLVFALWVGIGVRMSPEFYQQVVLREFLGRFDLSDAPVHKHQPPWFYVIHLLHKWGPWSVALVALMFDRRVRARLRTEPALLWLACWALGGLVVMSLVPSKRVDRIFPIIPPLCLLLASLAQEWFCARTPRHTRLMIALFWIAGLMSTGYTLFHVAASFRENDRALLHFGAAVKALTGARPDRVAVVAARDEGLLLYIGCTEFTAMKDAVQAWQRGELDRLVIREKDLRKRASELGPATRLLESPPIGYGPYFLIERNTTDLKAPSTP